MTRAGGLCAFALLAAGCSRLPILEGPVNHVERFAREPALAQLASGRLFIAGYGEETPSLWKSDDLGASWSLVNVGSANDGAIGNSDVDLAVAPDGTLYFVEMTFNRKTFEGADINVGVSTDAGATWAWTQVSKTRFDDRPWIRVTPNGVAHLIWNDGAGVRHATSGDRGKRWKERARIHDHGGSSHFASGPEGELAARIVPMSASGNKLEDGVDLIAVSTDDGETWKKYPAPGERKWTKDETAPINTMRWVEPLAWDAAGALYYLWTTPEALWLARSADRGASWSSSKIAEGGDGRFFPYLVARGDGELAATWWSGSDSAIVAHAGVIDVARDGAATLRETAPFRPDTRAWTKDPAAAPGPDPAGEYLMLRYLEDGTIGIVSPIQRPRDKRFGFSFWRMKIKGTDP